MKKSFFLGFALICITSLILLFVGNRISNIKKEENIIFVSNPAIGSLIKAITGDEFIIKTLGYYNENFHQHSVSPETLLHLQNAKMLFFTSIYEEPSIYSISQNFSHVKIIELFAEDSLLKNLNNTYYAQKYNQFLLNRQNIDPHFWLSAQATSYVLQTIFEIMINNFPYKVDIFKKNYNVAHLQMQSLIEQGTLYTKSCHHLNIFAIHDAFFYLHKDYNLKYNGGISDNLEYGLLPKSVAKLLELDKKNKICIILHNNEANSLIEKIKVIAPYAKYMTIDFDGISINYDKGIEGYKEFFITNIQNLIKCACEN